jgi:hypothetical protein
MLGHTQYGSCGTPDTLDFPLALFKKSKDASGIYAARLRRVPTTISKPFSVTGRKSNGADFDSLLL